VRALKKKLSKYVIFLLTTMLMVSFLGFINLAIANPIEPAQSTPPPSGILSVTPTPITGEYPQWFIYASLAIFIIFIILAVILVSIILWLIYRKTKARKIVNQK
jgi:hypothetical protein